MTLSTYAVASALGLSILAPAVTRADVPDEVSRGASAGPTDPVVGVRPGGPVMFSGGRGIEPKEFGSTLNFVFRDDDGHVYIGTCGHCIQSGGDGTERTWVYGDGSAPVALTPDGKRIGEVVYAACCGYASVTDPREPNSLRDFALIRLDRRVRFDPQMPSFGGPTGINDETSPEPVLVHWCGQGTFGPFTVSPDHPIDCRSGLAPGTPDRGYVQYVSFDVGGGGDSGSPVISDDRRALGVLVAYAGHLKGHRAGPGGANTGTIRAVRIAVSIADSERALRIGLELVKPRRRTG